MKESVEKKEKRDDVNPEEVEATLDSIREEQERKKNARRGFKKFLYAAAAPFRWIKAIFHAIAKRFRMPLGVKTTIIYTLLTVLATVAVSLFIVLSVDHRVSNGGAVDEAFTSSLWVTAAAVSAIAIALVVGLGSVASKVMLAPMRKMIKQIDDIDASDLSQRLDDVDSQDELRELTERINAMLLDIEESFTRQKKFVSDASHELKTPIAVIRGYSDLLARWGKEDKAVLNESVEAIKRESENMQRIVERLLFLAKIGKFALSPAPFDLAASLRKTISAYPVAGVSNPISYEGADSLVVTLDENMLSECVRALVDNAVKYSEPLSPVLVSLKKTDGGVEISVSDRGQGIAEKDLPYIFDRFYRCDKARARDGSSTGLGLTITKSIMETMNGGVSVRSTLGEGTTFTLYAPTEEKDS